MISNIKFSFTVLYDTGVTYLYVLIITNECSRTKYSNTPTVMKAPLVVTSKLVL